MMRIVAMIAGPYPALRGSQMLVGQLEHGLRARGHTVTVLSHGPEAPGVPRLDFGRLRRTARLARGLWRTLRREAVDVIHAHNYEAALVALPLGRATGTPVVFHGHAAFADELPTYAPPQWGRLLRVVGERLDRSIPRRADGVLTVTSALAERLRAYGVAADRIASAPPTLMGSDCPPRCATSVAEPVLCYAGNLDGYQNLGLLQTAFAVVRRNIPAARLVIATDEDPARWSAWRDQPGVEVRPVTTVAALQQTLAAAAIAVLPRTDASGFPMKLLNYLAAGNAIVVSAGSANGLQHDRHALVVPDHDAGAFAAAIIELLRDPSRRARLGAAARQLAEDPTPGIQTLDRIESLYRRVVARDHAAFRPVPQPE